MAGTTEDKLEKLLETKANIKNALSQKGQRVGDVFSEYPDAINNIHPATLGATTNQSRLNVGLSGGVSGAYTSYKNSFINGLRLVQKPNGGYDLELNLYANVTIQSASAGSVNVYIQGTLYLPTL